MSLRRAPPGPSHGPHSRPLSFLINHLRAQASRLRSARSGASLLAKALASEMLALPGITSKEKVMKKTNTTNPPNPSDAITSAHDGQTTTTQDGQRTTTDDSQQDSHNDKLVDAIKAHTAHISNVLQGSTTVALRSSDVTLTPSVYLWERIRRATDNIGFKRYSEFMDFVMCGKENAIAQQLRNLDCEKSEKLSEIEKKLSSRFLPFNDTDAYRLLKVATEAFLMVSCEVFDDGNVDPEELERRFEQNFTPGETRGLENDYLVGLTIDGDFKINKIIPFLLLVRRNLNGSPVLSKTIEEKLSLTRCGPAEERCSAILSSKLTNPCFLELIWSYFLEEAMLVQTINTITLRFQNVRRAGDHDPLANLEIDPLRPLNNLLWGYIQDEQHRLSVLRRGYEYDHHYGISIYGKAIGDLRTADSRSKFLEAFHTLLYLSAIFFKEADDTTVKPDGFPLLNALKEVHLILSEGMHNQYGDLPWTARIEMLMQQWLLARPEFREFLPMRTMVAYPETWMSRVDAMKNLYGWIDTSVIQFNNLAIFGEKLLLSIRFHNWSEINDRNEAANWGKYWRSEIQGYIHAYRAVTGVDLATDASNPRQAAARALQPSMHLRNRLAMQRNRQLQRV
jgi:hypothetical protein